jgi:hypothetical protein
MHFHISNLLNPNPKQVVSKGIHSVPTEYWKHRNKSFETNKSELSIGQKTKYGVITGRYGDRWAVRNSTGVTHFFNGVDLIP